MSTNKNYRFLITCYLLLATCCLLLISDEVNPRSAERQRIKTAVENGLNWLVKQQNANGSWTCRIGCKLNESYVGKEVNDNIAVTALAGMSFLAQGSTPKRGKYGAAVSRALDFILECTRESDGYITRHGSRMYEHAFATLFLAEIYGMSPRDDVKGKLKKAVGLIIQSQNKDGGWRYQPSPIDADISVTVSTLQALRAARNVGINVPIDVINKAMKYVHASARDDGSFRYQLYADTRSSPALTAAGVVALLSAGEYDAKEVERGLRYLAIRIPRPNGTSYPYHYFYGHYYLAQAMYQSGGKHWENYSAIMHPDILIAQKPDGSWSDDVGPTYATAMATLILQIPSEYLPIFTK